MARVKGILNKRTGAGIVTAAVVICMLTACGFGSGKVSDTTGTPEVSGGAAAREQTGLAPDSILNFHEDRGFARLQSDMESGDIPVECNVLYDSMGSRPDVTVKDPEVIRDIYERLCAVTVGEKTSDSVTDAYHHVTFRLRNDSYVSCYFEGENLFCWGKDNYSVSGSGPLWSYVRQLQETAMRESGQTLAAGDGAAQNTSPNAGSDSGSSAKKQETSTEKTVKDQGQTAGTGRTADYTLAGGAPADLEEPEAAGSPQSGNDAQDNARLSGGNPTGGQQVPVSADGIQISGQETGDTELPAPDAGTEITAGESDTRSPETDEGAGAPAQEPGASGEGTEAAGQEPGASGEGTEAAGQEPGASGEGTETAVQEETAGAGGQGGSTGTEDPAEPAESTDPGQTAAEGETTDPQARTQPAVKGSPDAAYTDIVRAYAAVKAQDPQKFLEDFENGRYTADAAEAASGDTSGNGTGTAVDPRINYELFRTYFTNPDGNSIYYGLRDYNADGVQELVILMGPAGSPQVWAVYTYDGTKAVSLFTGRYALAERNNLFVLPDGRFMIHGSGGATAGRDVICRIAAGGTGLEVIAEYTYDEQANGSMDHISDTETLTDEAFREKYYGQQSTPEEGVSTQNAAEDSTVTTAPAQAEPDPVVYEEYEVHKERHELEEEVELKKY